MVSSVSSDSVHWGKVIQKMSCERRLKESVKVLTSKQKRHLLIRMTASIFFLIFRTSLQKGKVPAMRPGPRSSM